MILHTVYFFFINLLQIGWMLLQLSIWIMRLIKNRLHSKVNKESFENEVESPRIASKDESHDEEAKEDDSSPTKKYF